MYIKDYPRPQFVREDFIILNGEWDFCFDDENVGENEGWYNNKAFKQKIQVPFTYETKASGIGDEKFHPYVWYSKKLSIPSSNKNKRVIIHFEGSDYITKVWVNGRYVGDHRGGYVRFSFDITDFLNFREDYIVVKVEDSKSCLQPRGKQRWMDDNFGCWYIQTTGIWKTVWIEYLNDTALDYVKITPLLDDSSVEFEYYVNGELKDLSVETIIKFKDKVIRTSMLDIKRNGEKLTVDLLSDFYEWKVKTWTPENPNLYDVEFRLYKKGDLLDRVYSYFGMRKVSIENGQVLLNNSPIYQRLILDQGYWDDSHLTPPSEDAIKEDIDKIIEMGYNGVRKHQKIEDERFYYWCDRKGLLVWCEMPSTYEFNDIMVTQFTSEWINIVRQYYNHTSIVTWVPFNESWGIPNINKIKKQQDFTQSIYYITKAFDHMRPVITNDGWEHTISDIITIHDYEEFADRLYERYIDKDKVMNNNIAEINGHYVFADGHKYKGQPIIISEYGGIAFHSKSGWGYGNMVSTEEDFFERFEDVTDAIKKLDYVCGFCYTQLTDVQQEINGLLQIDRKPKVDLEKIKKVNLK